MARFLSELFASKQLQEKECRSRRCFAFATSEDLIRDSLRVERIKFPQRNAFLVSLYEPLSEMYAYRGIVVWYRFLTDTFRFSREIQCCNKKTLKRNAKLGIQKRKSKSKQQRGRSRSPSPPQGLASSYLSPRKRKILLQPPPPFSTQPELHISLQVMPPKSPSVALPKSLPAPPPRLSSAGP